MRRGDRYLMALVPDFLLNPILMTYFLERNYVIGYGSSPENFDKDLLMFETKLKSLNWTDADATVVALNGLNRKAMIPFVIL